MASIGSYDAWRARQAGFDRHFFWGRHALQCLPTVRAQGLKGGVRLGRALTTHAHSGGWHAPQRSMVLFCELLCSTRVAAHKWPRQWRGVRRHGDHTRHTLRARCIVNATGCGSMTAPVDGEATGRPVRPS